MTGNGTDRQIDRHRQTVTQTDTDIETDLLVRETEAPHVQVNQEGAAALVATGDVKRHGQTDRQTNRIDRQTDRETDLLV